MATNDSVDPTVQEADQRAARAKASLLSRVELLKHKLSDARHKLDLPAQISEHPLPAIGIAFALGMLVGRRRSPPAETRTSGRIRRAAVAVGLRMVRNIALGQLAEIARQWWSERQAHHERQVHAARESGVAGRAPSLKH